MIDGGSSFKTCQDTLEVTFKNTVIYRTQQNIFWQDVFAHVLQGACKADVLDLKSKDDKGGIVVRIVMVKKFLRLVLRGQRRVQLVQDH